MNNQQLKPLNLITGTARDLKEFTARCIDLGIQDQMNHDETNPVKAKTGMEVVRAVKVTEWRVLHEAHARRLYMLGRDHIRLMETDAKAPQPNT